MNDLGTIAELDSGHRIFKASPVVRHRQAPEVGPASLPMIRNGRLFRARLESGRHA